MKIGYRSLLLALGFILLIGCQSTQVENIFRLQPNDSDITTSVNSAFMTNKILAPTHITVDTMNGTVYLSGYVKTIRQSDTAEDIAKKVGGVKMVQNNIIVRK
jgi:osmotically-inducible protein OsmY